MTQSYFENIDLYLIGELMRAQQTIRAAVAWCTDPRIIRALATKQSEGVRVELLVNDDQINRKADYTPITSVGGVVIYISKNTEIMHHKFCIIDNNSILGGSYNWTRHANTNDEQLTITTDNQEELDRYNEQFEMLSIVTEQAKSLVKQRDPKYPAPFVTDMPGAPKHCQALVDAATYANMQMLKNVGAVASNMSFGAMATQALQEWVDRKIKEYVKKQKQ